MNIALTRILILGFVFLLFAMSAVADKSVQPGKSWEEKNIAEWDETDVKTILQNSPWSKVLEGGPISGTTQFGTVGYNVRSLYASFGADCSLCIGPVGAT